jgi:uncharacterized membrane protein YwzB
MKTNVLFTALCFAACLCGCNEANDPPDSPTWIVPEPEPPQETGCPFKFPPSVSYPLADTQWKLVGSIDAETGALTTYQHPKECADCYTLSFDTDSTATAHTGFEDLRIDIFHLDTCMNLEFLQYLFVDKEPEVTDAKLLTIILSIIGSYSVSPDALLLYYYQSRRLCYLLFMKIES